MRPTRIACFGGIVALGFSSQTAFAQAEGDDVPDDSAIEEIIVTGVPGALGESLKRDATYSINTLDEEDLQQLAPISTADMLQNVPGVFAEGSTAGEASNNITVRGLPVVGGYRYAPQLIDGLPWFEEPEVPLMNNDTAARGDLMTERIEVVKGGTGGILYSNGLGATINHITRTGGQQFEGAYKLETADYGFLRNDFYVSGPFSDSLTYAVGGYYRTSDGLRDTGFTADRGGQIRGNLVWLSDDDRTEAQLHFSTIDDHTAFYQNLPFQIPAFNEPGTPENPIEIDPDRVWELGLDFGEGTVASNLNRHFVMMGEYGIREVDVADGLHADFDLLTFKLNREFDGGWHVGAGLRHSDGTNDFDTLFTGNDSTSAERFLRARYQNDVVNPALGQALSGDYGGAQLAGFFDVPDDPAAAFTGISRSDFIANHARGTEVGAFYVHNGERVADDTVLNYLLPFIGDTAADSTSFDLQVRKSFDLAGTHDLTFGFYASDYAVDTQFQGLLIVSTMEETPALADLFLVGGAGNPVGPALTLDGVMKPSLFGFVSEFAADSKAFYIHDHWELMNGRLKIDGGVRWHEMNGFNRRLNRNITPDSNFTPDGIVPGSPEDTIADNDVLLPSDPRDLEGTFTGTGWSIGANYSISNDFAAYALVSDSFRLPSVDDFIEAKIDPVRGDEEVEKIWQYEGGLRYYADTWDTQVALFYNEFSPRSQSVSFRDFTSSECLVNEGIADLNTCPLVFERFRRGVENVGVEIEAAWYPTFAEGLEISGNVVFQRPEIVDANFRVVHTLVENDVVVGHEFREVGENGRLPRRLSESMFQIQGVWDTRPLLGVPFKPYFKFTFFDERFAEAGDNDVTLYPGFHHWDGGFIWDFNADMSLQVHASNITDELTFTEGDRVAVPLKGPNGATNRGVARPLFGRKFRAMFNYRF